MCCRRVLLVLGLCAATMTGGPAVFAADTPSKFRVMPEATVTDMVPMRDRVRLKTYVYLPQGKGPWPTILIRTVYKNGIVNWGNSRPDRYHENGYAMVWQMVRGRGGSEGDYRFLADDRNDGYDTVEWIASQSWSDGNVGMDHASYLGSTQIQAAAAAPPHLKAIVPYVPAVDLFRELPYDGGVFTRYHVLNWHRLISVNSRAELTEGFMNFATAMEDPKWSRHLSGRPVIDAADGLLEGDALVEYRAFLRHPTIDDFWKQRIPQPEHYAKMGNIGVLLVSGNFDPTVGALTAWRGMEAHTPNPSNRHLLIGPWTHAQTYSATDIVPGEPGGPPQPASTPVTKNGPYEFGNAAAVDMFALRIAFYDQYLKGKKAPAKLLPDRVRVFVTGSNEWREFDTIPVPQRKDTKLFLGSEGEANSASGNGVLTFKGSSGAADQVVADPFNPVVDVTHLWFNGTGKYANVEQRKDVLVYTSESFDKDLTVIGEPEAHLQVAADTRDTDVFVNIHELYPDGKSVRLGNGGGLRLRYREGFDREVPLEPGKTYSVRIPLTYIGHTIKAGHRLRVQISGTQFPFKDPNPNTGEPIGTAVKMQRANISLFHDSQRPSFVLLPVVAPARR